MHVITAAGSCTHPQQRPGGLLGEVAAGAAAAGLLGHDVLACGAAGRRQASVQAMQVQAMQVQAMQVQAMQVQARAHPCHRPAPPAGGPAPRAARRDFL